MEKSNVHPIHKRDHTDLDMTEYQRLAHGTAVYPRVFTESQVLQMFGYFSVSFEELHGVTGDQFVAVALEAMDHFETPFNRLVYPILGLVGEAGEMANKLKKVARDSSGAMDLDRSADLKKELGDVMWYVAEVATGLDAELAQVGNDNIDKLYSRKERGVLGGDGDNR